MFAVVKTGGKQYRVAANDVITVEKLVAETGATVSFDEVLMLGGEEVRVGAPFVAGAHLARQQPVQQDVAGAVVLDRLGQLVRQSLGRVRQAQPDQPLTQLIDLHGGRAVAVGGAHRLTSASAAYRSTGRCWTGCSRISCSR